MRPRARLRPHRIIVRFLWPVEFNDDVFDRVVTSTDPAGGARTAIFVEGVLDRMSRILGGISDHRGGDDIVGAAFDRGYVGLNCLRSLEQSVVAPPPPFLGRSKNRETATLSWIPFLAYLFLDRSTVLRYSRLRMSFGGLRLKDAIDQMIDGRFFTPMPPAIGIVSGRSVHSCLLPLRLALRPYKSGSTRVPR